MGGGSFWGSFGKIHFIEDKGEGGGYVLDVWDEKYGEVRCSLSIPEVKSLIDGLTAWMCQAETEEEKE